MNPVTAMALVQSAMLRASLLGSNLSLASPAYAYSFESVNYCYYRYSVRRAANTVAATVPAHKPRVAHGTEIGNTEHMVKICFSALAVRNTVPNRVSSAYHPNCNYNATSGER